MFGIHGGQGVRVKIFGGCEPNIENEINEFLKEHEGSIIDIKFGSNERTYDVMVVYRETEDQQ